MFLEWLEILGAFASAVAIFAITSLLTRHMSLSGGEALTSMNVAVATATSFALALAYVGAVTFQEVVPFLVVTLAFYAAMILSFVWVGYFWNKALTRVRLRPTVSAPSIGFESDALLFLLVLMSAYLGYLALRQGAGPEGRIVLAKDFRGLDILRMGALQVYACLVSFQVASRQISWKSYIARLVVVVLVGSIAGSKGVALVFVFAFFTIRGAMSGGERFSAKQWLGLGAIGVLALLAGAGVRIFWGESPEEALIYMIWRILLSGDIYLYGLIDGNYKHLFGQYDWLSYVLHPVTALVGVRGYENPLGVDLFGGTTGDYSGYGPNAQLPMLAVVLANGNLTGACAIAVAFGFAFIGLRVLGIWMFSSNVASRPATSVIAVAATVTTAPLLFSDYGVFWQTFIGTVVVGFGLGILSALRVMLLFRSGTATVETTE